MCIPSYGEVCYDLLHGADRDCFSRLAVFVGGFTLDAAEAVWSDDEEIGDGGGRIASLVGKSLVQREENDDAAPRFSMLETIHDYATEHLEADAQSCSVRGRHARYYLALAEEADRHALGSEQREWLNRLELEHGNLLAALEWAKVEHECEMGLCLATAMRWFWHVRGHLREGRAWLALFLAHAIDVPPELTIGALNASGILAMDQGDFDQAQEQYERALGLSTSVHNIQGMARASNNLGLVAGYRGEYPQARARYEEALPLFRKVGDVSGTANALGNLGLLEQMEGHYERARSAYQESVALFREIGDIQNSAHTLNNLACVAEAEGRPQRAWPWYEESVSLFRQIDDKQGMARSLIGVACVATEERAGTALAEGLHATWDLDDTWATAFAFDELAYRVAVRGDAMAAARLWGAAEAARSNSNAPLAPADQAKLRDRQAITRATLPPDTFDTAYDDARATPLSETLSLAFDLLERMAPAAVK